MGVDEHWLVKLCAQTFQGTCECHFFEFVGIPCAHLLKVFSKLDMVEIPEFFVMKRWLKGANKYRVIDNEECAAQGKGNIMELSQLCHEATQVACAAVKTKEGSKLHLDTI
ncbi:aspartate transaminase [Ranunculus cassubicifolius]